MAGKLVDGRIALVTGGAQGIGKAIATRLLNEGAAAVALVDRSPQHLQEAEAELSKLGKVLPVQADITSSAEVNKAVAHIIKSLGGLHIAVNNAGIAGASKKAWEYSDEDWGSVMRLNIDAVFYVCRAVAPHLRAQNYGRIVNIASIAGKEGNPNASAYSASKAAVIGLTKSLAKEMARDGVLVNAIAPAAIETAIFQQISKEHVQYMLDRIPMGRLGEVQEAAALAAWLCSGECSFSTGFCYDLSGGRATY